MSGKSVAKLQQEKRKVEGNLHHKSFQGHSFKVVRVLVVELQVVMKDEGGLHVQWHLEPNRCCTCSGTIVRLLGWEVLTCLVRRHD